MEATRCRGCGAPIVFLRTAAGKLIPCDLELVPIRLNPEGRDRVVVEGYGVMRCDLTFDGTAQGKGRIPHFATCPAADDFRKR